MSSTALDGKLNSKQLDDSEVQYYRYNERAKNTLYAQQISIKNTFDFMRIIQKLQTYNKKIYILALKWTKSYI